MATIRKRGDYQWQAIVKKKGYPNKVKTFSYRADADKWARMVESEMERGLWRDTSQAESTTLAEALERYRDEVSTHKKGAPQELRRIARWLKHPLSKRFLASLRGADFAGFRDEWRKAGKAENTIRLELALISHLFEVARKEWGMEGLINPIKSITLPKPSNKRDRRLEDDEGERIMAELRRSSNPYAAPAIEFAMVTAMRRSNVVGLYWDDVDWAKSVIRLRDTKNGEKNRQVPLAPRAISILESLPRPSEGGRIFRITQDGMSGGFIRARERARARYEKECAEKGVRPDPKFLKDLRLHDLRHEATSRLFEGNLDSMVVAAITGHKTVQMLQRYTQLRPEKLAELLAKLAAEDEGCESCESCEEAQ